MKLLLKKLFKLCSTNNTSTTTTTTVSLPINLRKRLENISLERRRAIVSKTRKGCAPLFVACRNGHVNIVKYLILTCDVNVEQKGVLVEESFENIEWRGIFRRAEPYAHFHYRYRFNVTPLWCATAYGYLEIVEFLFQHGADLNSVVEPSGFTPVRKACALNRIDLVSFFVRNGADILKPDKEGVTCLMVSARLNTDMCEILLRGGARKEINARDRDGQTALHYAIGKKNFSTLKLLLAYGADPFLQCRNGHDALQTACLYQFSEIFEYLRVNVTYTPERLADAYELLGALLFLSDDHPDDPGNITLWRKAAQVRRTAGVIKRVSLKVEGRIFAFTHEFRDEEELDRVLATPTNDALWEAVKTQAFLICERVLPVDSIEWIHFLMGRGHSLGTDPKAIDFFFHALELQMPLAYTKLMFSISTLSIVGQLVYIFYFRASTGDFIHFEDPFVILAFLGRKMDKAVNSYSDSDSDLDSDSDSDSDSLKTVTFEMNIIVGEAVKLIVILIKITQNEIQAQAIRQLVSDLLRLDLPTSVLEANSLLYAAIEMEGYFSITFPTVSITSFLLSLGADVNATNVDGYFPLIQAALMVVDEEFSNYRNVYQELVKRLLDAGAHIDQVMFGKTLTQYIGRQTFFELTGVDSFLNLKCFAARAIQRYQIPYGGNVPQHLENFIRLH